MKYQPIVFQLFLMVFLIGCATNPVVNGKNVGGLVGASGGAYGGSVLTKNVRDKSLSLTRSNQVEIKNYKRK